MNMPPNLDQRGWEMRVSVTSRLAREAAPSETHVVLARQCGCVDDPDDRRAAVLAFSTRLVEAPGISLRSCPSAETSHFGICDGLSPFDHGFRKIVETLHQGLDVFARHGSDLQIEFLRDSEKFRVLHR